MKTANYLIAFFVIFFTATAFAESGDISFWLPSGETNPASPQVERNCDYFSIKLHSVYAYYKSGFFENIRNIAVVTETAISDEKKTVQPTMLNKVWQQFDRQGDFIGINDHLVVLSPATISNVKIKVSYRGIGKDKFKFVFDALSDQSLKTALSVSPATTATISAISPLVKKLLESSYTESNPRQVLDINQSFIVYPKNAPLKPDSLREGYFVIVSARENKSDDLSFVLTHDKSDLRLNGTETGLEYNDNGVWKPFRRNSYIILSVTRTDVRGENENTDWFAKYSEAERIADEKLRCGDSSKASNEQIFNLWRDGNALLSADANYIDAERKSIKILHYAALKPFFDSCKSIASQIEIKSVTDFGIPRNFLQVAEQYRQAVDKQAAQIAVVAQNENGAPLSDVNFSVNSFDNSGSKAIIGKTDKQGELIIKNLKPGMYSIETMGNEKSANKVVVVDPKDSKKVGYNKSSNEFFAVMK